MTHDPGEDRIDRRLRAAGFRPDDRAVSEIVGSLFLIAITVLLVGGLSILVLNVKPPADQLHVDLSMLVTRGADGVWNTGDEQLKVQHTGGEAIPAEGLSIQVDISGSITSYGGSGLNGSFADGELTIGETWSTTLTIPIDADVDVEMVLDAGRSSILITSTRVRTGGTCEPDTTAPTVADWQQTPPDVTAATTGAITIIVEVIDECSGVDESVDPHLEYRLNDGTDPAWTDLGAMSDAGVNLWTADIPDPTWLSELGNSLQYRATGMTDMDGNSGNSSFQSDPIQFTGTATFTDAHTENTGTVSDFTDARSDSDGGAYATLTEAGAPAPNAYYGTDATGNGGTGTATDASGPADDTYYILDSGGTSDDITVDTIDTGAATGPIAQVDLVFEGHYEGTRSDDTVNLNVDFQDGGGFQNVLSGFVPTLGTSGNDQTQIVDITGNLGSWSWTDVQNLELQAEYNKISGPDNMDVYVDALWVVVTVSGGATMDIELEFPSLPAAATHVLELEYAVTQETFHVDVWDGTTWNTRGVSLDQGGFTVWVYQLTGTEEVADAGSPLIRIIDDTGSSDQGTVRLDYAKVVSG